MIKIDFHVHSFHSLDSRQKYETILDRVEKKGLDGVVIVDHNILAPKAPIQSLIDARYHHVPIEKRPLVIRGAEYSTEEGHLIVIGLQEPLENTLKLDGKWYRCKDVIEGAKAQHAFIVLAHPFRWKKRNPSDYLWEHIDAVEVFNGRTCFVRGNFEANQKAVEEAKKRGLPITGGSDGHTPFEIGRTYVSFDVDKVAFDPQKLKNYNAKVHGELTLGIFEVYSQIYKMVTQKTWHKIPKQVVKAFYSVGIYLYAKINPKTFLRGEVAVYQREKEK